MHDHRACTFRDSYAKIKKAGIVLPRCSVDTAERPSGVCQKYGLPFPLLLDPDKKIAMEYGVARRHRQVWTRRACYLCYRWRLNILKESIKSRSFAQRVGNYQRIRYENDRNGELVTDRRTRRHQ